MTLRKNNMKKSFIMIEVIVSAFIASLVGMVLLQSQSNNTSLMHYIFTKKDIDKQSSFALATLGKRESASDKDTYELLNEAGFLIGNDEIIAYFKNLPLAFEKTLFTQIDLQNEDDELKEKVSNEAKNKQIMVNQIDIEIDGKQNKYFSIELQN